MQDTTALAPAPVVVCRVKQTNKLRFSIQKLFLCVSDANGWCENMEWQPGTWNDDGTRDVSRDWNIMKLHRPTTTMCTHAHCKWLEESLDKSVTQGSVHRSLLRHEVVRRYDVKDQECETLIQIIFSIYYLDIPKIYHYILYHMNQLIRYVLCGYISMYYEPDTTLCIIWIYQVPA